MSKTLDPARSNQQCVYPAGPGGRAARRRYRSKPGTLIRWLTVAHIIDKQRLLSLETTPAGKHRRAARAALVRIRKLCLALPETTERVSHGGPCFFVRGKTTFVRFADNVHDDGRLAIWCAAVDGMQQGLIGSDPKRFFRPPYVGHRGWIGVRLDVQPDWRQIATIVADAYRVVAPRKLVMSLESAPKPAAARRRMDVVGEATE